VLAWPQENPECLKSVWFLFNLVRMFNHLFTPRNFCLAVREGAACSGMGTWEGHISPGVAFYSFGIVFCFQYSREYLLQGKKTGAPKAKKDATRLGKVFIK